MKTPNSLFDIEQYRITSLTPVEPHKFLYKWEETPFLPRKELVAITGKAKSGKSFFESILMALCVRKQPLLNISRAEEKPYRALWIDTEQSEDTTKEILCERIDRMAYSGELNYDGISVDEMICTYNIRNVRWNHRFSIVSSAVLTVKPDIVFLDGIRDLVNDINDGSMAQHLVERLMSLADYANCCIVCVLHQNKAAEDKTLRGALGTELTNKAFETFEATKNQDTRQITIRQVATRKFDISGKLSFWVNRSGLPEICYIEEEEPASGKKKFNYFGHSVSR